MHTAKSAVTNTTRESPMIPPGQCTCPKKYRPVCGSDSQVYANRCFMHCENTVKRTNVKVIRRGKCKDTPKCDEENYEKFHKFPDWCDGGEESCQSIATKKLKKYCSMGKSQCGCQSKPKFIRDEKTGKCVYIFDCPGGSCAQEQYVYTYEQQAYFNKHGGGYPSHRLPQPPTDKVSPQCDENGDYKMMQHEVYKWCVNPKTGEEVPETRHVPKFYLPPITPEMCKKLMSGGKCALEEAMRKYTHPGYIYENGKLEFRIMDAFFPWCDENGNYKRVQSYGLTGSRWCVDPITGNKIDGTQQHYPEAGPINCSRVT